MPEQDDDKIDEMDDDFISNDILDRIGDRLRNMN
jgi:hypothetical protein